MEEKVYQVYDGLINETIKQIYLASKEKNKIVLVKLNPKDKEHLFILRIALMARDIFNIPVHVEMNFFKWLMLNWRMRKGFNRVLRIKNFQDNGIVVPTLSDYIRSQGQETLGETFKLGDIYDTYYEGSLG